MAAKSEDNLSILLHPSANMSPCFPLSSEQGDLSKNRLEKGTMTVDKCWDHLLPVSQHVVGCFQPGGLSSTCTV